jgi:hypothetical protein
MLLISEEQGYCFVDGIPLFLRRMHVVEFWREREDWEGEQLLGLLKSVVLEALL